MTFKREAKYEVLKLDDIEKYLSPGEKIQLQWIISTIQASRQIKDKQSCNSYVVVNEDEPYAEVVWKLIQAKEEGWSADKWEEEVRRFINYVIRYTMDNYILISEETERKINDAVDSVLAAARTGFMKV